MVKIILLSIFAASFGSFIFGMTYFFRTHERVPLGVLVIQLFGSIFLLLHLSLLLYTESVPTIYTYVGIAMYCAAFILFWFAVQSNRSKPLSQCYGTDIPEHLVVSGPYRWIRHPFYTAYMLAWLAGVFATGELWLLPSVAIMVIIYVYAAILEERKFMNSALATEFRSYRQRTGMFLPRINS